MECTPGKKPVHLQQGNLAGAATFFAGRTSLQWGVDLCTEIIIIIIIIILLLMLYSTTGKGHKTDEEKNNTKLIVLRV